METDHGIIGRALEVTLGQRRDTSLPVTRLPEAVMQEAPQVMLLLALLMAAVPDTTHAQHRIARLPDGAALGGAVEMFHYEDEGAITSFSFHLSKLKHNSVGLELGVGMFPEYLQARALVMTPDLGVGYNVSLPGATLVLRAGGSGIAALGQGLSELLPGAHLGGALLLRVDRRAAIRADLLKRWYIVGTETEPFWSFALGFAVLRR
jgi:hypothetical protein